ncbi:MAG: protein kinase, partial [Rhodococcus sp. (in: high G+C Gram-positive bacteria)]
AVALLAEGLRVAALHDLPRLRARIENEQVRLGLTAPGTPARTMPEDTTPHPDGTVEITLQIEDSTAIRLLSENGEPEAAEQAVDWARMWVRRTASRPRAHLQAHRLLASCLHAAGRIEEAEETLAVVADACAARGMVRYLTDGGPHVIATLTSMRERIEQGTWPDDRPRIDLAFVDEVLRLVDTAHRPVV